MPERADHALPDRPNLGLATTRQLLTELVVRMEITQDPRTTAGDWFGGVCAALREALPTKVLDYRTVDDVPPPEPPAYTPEELTEHYVHTVQNEDVIGCPICDAVARQRGSLLDNDQINDGSPHDD